MRCPSLVRHRFLPREPPQPLLQCCHHRLSFGNFQCYSHYLKIQKSAGPPQSWLQRLSNHYSSNTSNRPFRPEWIARTAIPIYAPRACPLCQPTPQSHYLSRSLPFKTWALGHNPWCRRPMDTRTFRYVPLIIVVSDVTRLACAPVTVRTAAFWSTWICATCLACATTTPPLTLGFRGGDDHQQ